MKWYKQLCLNGTGGKIPGHDELMVVDIPISHDTTADDIDHWASNALAGSCDARTYYLILPPEDCFSWCLIEQVTERAIVEVVLIARGMQLELIYPHFEYHPIEESFLPPPD